jgi:uncharacterized membrane protein
MKNVIIYSAMLISASILFVGSIIYFGLTGDIEFFYNIAGLMFLISSVMLIGTLVILMKVISAEQEKSTNNTKEEL